MRFVVWFVLLFVGAVICATIFGSNDGLVSFFWKSYRLDLSINLFLLLLIEACFILVLVMQGVRSLVGLPRRAREWRAIRKERSAQAAFRESLALYFGGRYGRAEKLAERALLIHSDSDIQSQENDFMALAHLLRAANAHRLQNHTHRDRQLALVSEATQRGGHRAVEE
ncbi:MAG: heme biosynthesis HemY N-terminal domain-containing protein, partial [Burkholderiales bacterium]